MRRPGSARAAAWVSRIDHRLHAGRHHDAVRVAVNATEYRSHSGAPRSPKPPSPRGEFGAGR